MSPILAAILILNLVVFLFAWKFADRDEGSAFGSIFCMAIVGIIDVLSFLVWAIAKIFQVH